MTTSPQVCGRTTLRNLNALLYNFTLKLLITQYSAITFNFNKCLLGMLSASLHVSADKFTACVQNVASRTHACFELHTPLVNGCVDNVLFNAAPNVQPTLSQFVNISNLCLVDALLHCSPDFVVRRVKIRTVPMK